MTVAENVWIASAGESFDMIAFNIYGDEKYASEIMTVNPTLCDKMHLTGGEIVKLPVIDVPEDSEEEFESADAPWKE